MTLPYLDDVQRTHLGAHEGHPTSPFIGDTPIDKLLHGIGLHLSASLELGGKVDRLLTAHAKLMERLQRFTPVDYQVTASAAPVAGVPLVLVLGTPDMGTFWQVEQCVIGGIEVNTTAVGQAGLYVVGTPPNAVANPNTPAGGLANIADRAGTLPNVGFYGRRDIVVNDFEYLVAIVFGGTTGQQYVAAASVSVFNVAAAAGRVDTVD